MTQNGMGAEGSTNQLSSARQITPQVHAAILGALRQGLDLLKSSGVKEPGVADLRVRDWWIVVDEGAPCLEIFLDKGYHENAKKPGTLENETRITLDECMEFHAFLLETDILDLFSDNLQIRVGSPGGEPSLRDEIDFTAYVGCMVSLHTWTKRENRDKFVMLLHEVVSSPGGALAVLKEGSHTFQVPLSQVKFAQALPHHPQTLLFKKGKVSKRK